MTATENVNQYRISSNFESSGILGIFTKIEVSSEHTEQFKEKIFIIQQKFFLDGKVYLIRKNLKLSIKIKKLFIMKFYHFLEIMIMH